MPNQESLDQGVLCCGQENDVEKKAALHIVTCE
jgi:hypothetical protein